MKAWPFLVTKRTEDKRPDFEYRAVAGPDAWQRYIAEVAGGDEPSKGGFIRTVEVDGKKLTFCWRVLHARPEYYGLPTGPPLGEGPGGRGGRPILWIEGLISESAVEPGEWSREALDCAHTALLERRDELKAKFWDADPYVRTMINTQEIPLPRRNDRGDASWLKTIEPKKFVSSGPSRASAPKAPAPTPNAGPSRIILILGGFILLGLIILRKCVK